MDDYVTTSGLNEALKSQTADITDVLNGFAERVTDRYTTLDTRLITVEENMATKESIDHLINTMDDFIRQITDNEAEQAARDAQWNRLIEWAREVSKKTGVPMPDL